MSDYTPGSSMSIRHPATGGTLMSVKPGAPITVCFPNALEDFPATYVASNQFLLTVLNLDGLIVDLPWSSVKMIVRDPKEVDA